MDTSKLVFLLIHGIGQQSEDVQQRFLTRVQAQAEELAGSRFKAGGCGPATGRLPRLVAERADWSRTYRRQKDTWLKVLFANLPPLSRIIFRIAFKVLVLVMVVRALISGGFYVVDYICEIVTGRCLDQCLNGSLLWVIESVLFTVLGALAVYLFAYRFIPWGYLFSLLRGFEAKTLSDVPVYLGRKGEVEIVCKVCSTLLSLHPRPCSFFDYLVDPDNYEFPPPSQRLNLVLAGHSQGSVIAFDMLYGSTQYMLWKAGDYRSEDTPVLRRRINQVQHFIGADRLRSRMLEDRRDCDLILRLLTRSSFHELMEELDLSWEEGQLLYYRLLEFLNQSFNPVGMVTFGSPIPLFIFRNPDLLPSQPPESGQLALWQRVCPVWFREDGHWNGLAWRWRNFWHSSDFVSHRVEPLFNGGFTGRFVEDRRRKTLQRDPVSAHSSYWVDSIVIAEIAQQLADTLCEMAAGAPVPIAPPKAAKQP